MVNAFTHVHVVIHVPPPLKRLFLGVPRKNVQKGT